MNKLSIIFQITNKLHCLDESQIKVLLQRWSEHPLLGKGCSRTLWTKMITLASVKLSVEDVQALKFCCDLCQTGDSKQWRKSSLNVSEHCIQYISLFLDEREVCIFTRTNKQMFEALCSRDYAQFRAMNLSGETRLLVTHQIAEHNRHYNICPTHIHLIDWNPLPQGTTLCANWFRCCKTVKLCKTYFLASLPVKTLFRADHLAGPLQKFEINLQRIRKDHKSSLNSFASNMELYRKQEGQNVRPIRILSWNNNCRDEVDMSLLFEALNGNFETIDISSVLQVDENTLSKLFHSSLHTVRVGSEGFIRVTKKRLTTKTSLQQVSTLVIMSVDTLFKFVKSFDTSRVTKLQCSVTQRCDLLEAVSKFFPCLQKLLFKPRFKPVVLLHFLQTVLLRKDWLRAKRVKIVIQVENTVIKYWKNISWKFDEKIYNNEHVVELYHKCRDLVLQPTQETITFNVRL